VIGKRDRRAGFDREEARTPVGGDMRSVAYTDALLPIW